MPELALPPYLFVAARGNLPRVQFTIPRRMPLGGDRGKDGGERICNRGLFPCAIRTAGGSAFGGSLSHRNLPFVVGAMGTPPPDPFDRARWDSVWREVPVFGGVPLRRHVGEMVGKGVCH